MVPPMRTMSILFTVQAQYPEQTLDMTGDKDGSACNFFHQRRSFGLLTSRLALDIMLRKLRSQNIDLRRPRIHGIEFGP